LGYTQYYYAASKWRPTKRQWKQLLIDTDAIIVASAVGVERIYKYDPDGDVIIWLNGFGDDLGHETFILQRKSDDNEFCKTDRKPYDVVVAAILIIAHTMGLAVSSDGWLEEEEWADALRLARKATKRKGLKLPAGLESRAAAIKAREKAEAKRLRAEANQEALV